MYLIFLFCFSFDFCTFIVRNIYIFTICTNVAQLHLHVLSCMHFYQHIVIENSLFARVFLGFESGHLESFFKLTFL